jgi:hypothetical protein
MSKKEKSYLLKVWTWLRTEQGLTLEQAEQAMNLSVEEYDALIDGGAA